jgi:cysteine synthase
VASGRGGPVASSILELIGRTPLVELPRLARASGLSPRVQLYAKLEGQNPTGSIKDRFAAAMVAAAESQGRLSPGQTLLEPTSGNTGISLAMVGRLRGYGLTCVMPESVTEERKRLLGLYGAEIVYSPGEQGSNGAVRLALELSEQDDRHVMLFQYGNAANVRAHYEGTGAEIADALERLDVFVAGLGTGGTLMGAGARLRERFAGVTVAAAEPLPGDPVMGLRSLEEGYVPPILDVAQLDRKLLVTNAESAAGVRALLEHEAILAGLSSGAVIHAACRLAAELEEGVVASVLADGGWKYLSAPFWQGGVRERDLERSLWW